MSLLLALNTDPSFFVDELIAGLTLGAVYALIALGYTMIYGILKLLNFAHGDVYMVGAYIGYFVLTGLGGPLHPRVPIVVLILLMFLAAMLGCGLLGVVIERFAYRPLRNAPRIAPLITALGVSFFLQASAQLLFGAEIRSYDTFNLQNSVLFEKGIHRKVFGVTVDISLVRILVILSAIFLMAGADAVRRALADRKGDARDVLRPRGGGDDGDQRRPRDRRDVLHRLGARGRGRRDDGARLPADLDLHGLPGRAEGVHRRGDRRDRQHSRVRCSAASRSVSRSRWRRATSRRSSRT